MVRSWKYSDNNDDLLVNAYLLNIIDFPERSLNTKYILDVMCFGRDVQNIIWDISRGSRLTLLRMQQVFSE